MLSCSLVLALLRNENVARPLGEDEVPVRLAALVRLKHPRVKCGYSFNVLGCSKSFRGYANASETSLQVGLGYEYFANKVLFICLLAFLLAHTRA